MDNGAENGINTTSPLLWVCLSLSGNGGGEGAVYLMSPGRPTDIGLQLGR